jgi:hypothetical protein
LASWAEELSARAQRVRHLIGDAHWLSDGNHKEALLREFLRRYLPPGLIVSKGFIRSPSEQNNCSPEVDILITDPGTHPPFFAEGELQVVSPTSVVAHIEVKTTFTRDVLDSALQNTYQTQLVISKYTDASKVWRCVCFYSIPGTRTTESVLATVEESILNLCGKMPASNKDIGYLHFLPTCITTISPYIIFLAPDEDCSLKLRLFDVDSLSLSCALADLFSAVRRWAGGPVVGELDDFINALDIPKPVIHTIKY